jgi:enoyl-CoA hydratase
MQNENVTYDTDGPVAIVTLNRPRYRNAQSWGLLDGVDEAFNLAEADDNVRIIVVRGAGEHFSSGHDLGTPESIAEREIRGASDEGLDFYQNFRKYNIDYLLKWRNSPKPSISTVRGYCIFAGWMLAAATDLVFADTSARFLPGLVEYFTQPWDLGVRKAKELIFESRFIEAEEARDLGFVNRVYAPDDLERETMAYAHRVAENQPLTTRLTKLAINKAQDAQGFTSAVESAFADYVVMMRLRSGGRVEGARRLVPVDLAVKGLKGERYGQK